MISPLKNFRYARPETLDQLLNLVSKEKKISVMSGGTDLIPTLKFMNASPEVLISLTGLKGFSEITVNQKILKIGSQVTLSDCADNRDITTLIPCLSETAKKIASPQIRNRATVGGNLLVNTRCPYFNQSEFGRKSQSGCFKAGGEACQIVKTATREMIPLCRARFVSDLAPVFLILNAELYLASLKGLRKIFLRDFYCNDGISRNQLKPNEILTQIEVNLNELPKIAYEKLRIRNALDFPSLGVAVGWNKKNKALSVSMTGVESKPFFAEFFQERFTNEKEMLSAACLQVSQSVALFKQDFFPPSYRKKMIPVLIRRAWQKVFHLHNLHGLG